MKEVDKKDMPEVSGGEFVSNGTTVGGAAYPIFQAPNPDRQPDPSSSSDQLCVDPLP